MKNFLKYFLATFLGLFVFTGAMIIIFIAIVASSSSSSEDIPKPLSKSAFLEIKLNGSISDPAKQEELDLKTFDSKKSLSLLNILTVIDSAAADDKIEGIVLRPDGVGNLANIYEIRESLENFKKSGKPILAYGENYSVSSLYLASIADSIYVHHDAMCLFPGIQMKSIYFKEMLEKVGVEPIIIKGRDNQYKSAVEPFMRNSMSDAHKEQIEPILFGIWSKITETIGESRKMSSEEINQIADNTGLMTGDEMCELKLADKAVHMDEFNNRFGKKKKHRLVKAKDYFSSHIVSSYAQKGVAVLYANGQIMPGDTENSISDNFIDEIKKVKKNENVKAVVLRVNSPGGSAFLSEKIWRELQLLKEKKPILVSMGNVAASGGYYIACAADTVYANPMTITGSIGVFMTLMNSQELLNDKLGIHTDQYGTNNLSNLFSGSNDKTEKELSIFQKSADNIYDKFLGRVSTARNLSKNEVEDVAKGRVWNQQGAFDAGLVDRKAGLMMAINSAKKMAELPDDFAIYEYPKPKSPFESIMEALNSENRNQVLLDTYLEEIPLAKEVHSALQQDGPQMRVPFLFEIK